MAALLNEHSQNETPLIARNWVKILAQYREPNTVRSVFELLVTLIPFLSLWSLAWWLLTDYPWMAFAVALSNGSMAKFCIVWAGIPLSCSGSARCTFLSYKTACR